MLAPPSESVPPLVTLAVRVTPLSSSRMPALWTCTVGMLLKLVLTSSVPPVTLAVCTWLTVRVDAGTVPEATTSMLVPVPPVMVVVPVQPLSVNVSLLGPPVNSAAVTLSRSIESVPVTLLPLIVRLDRSGYSWSRR